MSLKSRFRKTTKIILNAKVRSARLSIDVGNLLVEELKKEDITPMKAIRLVAHFEGHVLAETAELYAGTLAKLGVPERIATLVMIPQLIIGSTLMEMA